MQHTLPLPPATPEEQLRFNRRMADERAKRAQLTLALPEPIRPCQDYRKQDRLDRD